MSDTPSKTSSAGRPPKSLSWLKARGIGYTEIGLFILILVGCIVSQRYLIPRLVPIDGGFQSYAMLWPLQLQELPGVDYIPYLGVGMNYALSPLFFLLGGDFFAAMASAETMTVLATSLLAGVLCIIFGLGWRFYTMILIGLCVWAAALSTLVLGASGLEFLVAGNSLLVARQGLPWLVFALMAIWAMRARAGIAAKSSTDTDPATLPLIFPVWPAPVLAGLAPLWSNASGLATMLALLITTTLAVMLIVPGWLRKLKSLGIGLILFLASFAAAVTLISGGHPQFYLTENFLGVADYQFWYFAPFGEDRRIYDIADLLQAAFLPFGPRSVISHLGAVVGLGYLLWRYGPRDLRFLGALFILMAHFGTGLIAQIGGHTYGRYMLVTYSVALAMGVIAIACVIVPPVATRLGRDRLYLLGRGGAVLVLSLLTVVIISDIIRERRAVDWTFFPPLGLYVPQDYADELYALETLGETLIIAEQPPQERLFASYLSSAEIALQADPASRFGSIIHALGDEARAEYLEDFHRTTYPLAAVMSPVPHPRFPYWFWHVWNLRANWFFYSDMIKTYQPAFRTQHLVFFEPRDAALEPLQAALTCQIEHLSDAETRLTITDTAAVPGDDWLFDLTLTYSTTLESSPIPMLGSRGMITVSDRSSALMADMAEALKIQKVNEAVYTETGGAFYGLPLRGTNAVLPVEHRLGTPSVIDLEAQPGGRAALEVTGCQVTALAPSPFADLAQQVPVTSDLVGPRTGQ